MQILQQSPTQLTLRFRPWFMWICGGFFAIVMVPYAFAVFSHYSKAMTLRCQRVKSAEGTCHLIQSTMRGEDNKTIPLQELQGARFDKSPIRSDGSQDQQVILLTKRGEIPFWFVKTYHPNVTSIRLDDQTAKINGFVKSVKGSSLNVQLSHVDPEFKSVFGFLFYFFTIGNSIWFVFCSAVVTWTFDKTLGSMTQKRQWFWIVKTVEHPIQDIVNVQVEERFDRSGKSHRISLILPSGKRLPLTAFHTNYYSKKKNVQKIADCITEFLNIQSNHH